MNIFFRTAATLAFVLSGSVAAQPSPSGLGASVTAQVKPSVCVPYSIPIQSTITDCGPGMVGTKYKTSDKACPSGEVKQSETFVTSACQTSAIGSNGALTAEAKCRITPGACAAAPTPANCASGRLWTLAGSGVAHCVDQDPPCAGGTVNHDALGNPTNCQTSASKTKSCPSGYTGSIKQRRDVYTWMDGSTTYGSWSVTRDTCEEIPAPPPPPPPPVQTCSPGTSTSMYAACPSGSGTYFYRETVTCPAGSTGSPSYSGVWDYSGCSAPSTPTPTPTPTPGPTPACTPSSSTASTSCGSGFSGTKYITTYYTCPSGTYQTENDSQCGCANGANNYPTCTPPYQEPVTPPVQPSGCEDVYGSIQPVGSTVGNCMIPSPSNPYPRGRTYRCGTSGWTLSSSGSGSVQVYCD